MRKNLLGMVACQAVFLSAAITLGTLLDLTGNERVLILLVQVVTFVFGVVFGHFLWGWKSERFWKEHATVIHMTGKITRQDGGTLMELTEQQPEGQT